MKNTLLWVILAVVLLGGGYWIMTKSSTDTDDTNQEATSDTGTQQTSIKKLMAAGRPVSCTYSDATNKTEATVYLSGDKMVGDFISEGTKMNMLNDGAYVYIWEDGTNQGFKMASTTVDSSASADSVGTPDLEAEQNLDCRAWTVTPASFTPPTSVTFSALPTGLGN